MNNLPRLLFVVGVVARILVYVSLSPFNNDGEGHLEYVAYLAKNHLIPRPDFGEQTYHPPLYYSIASLFYFNETALGLKLVQLPSLICSLATLLIFYRLVVKTKLFRPGVSRNLCFAIPAVLPQFIFCTMIISNDPLSILIGTAICYQFAKARSRTITAAAWIGVLVGLGLLSKGYFLVFWPLSAYAIWSNTRGDYFRKRLKVLLVYVACSSLIGCWQYVRCQTQTGKLTFSNLDMDLQWVGFEKEQYLRWRNRSDTTSLDVYKLFADPILHDGNQNLAPLSVLYSSFWYNSVPDGPFRKMQASDWRHLGALLDAAGIVPTLLFMVGTVIVLVRNPGQFCGFRAISRRSILLLLFLMNMALLFFVLNKYAVWTVLQSRLLFATFPGVLMAIDVGIRRCSGRHKVVEWIQMATVFFVFVSLGYLFLATCVDPFFPIGE